MPTNTTANVALTVEITFNAQPLAFECQVIDAELTLPGVGAGSGTEVACPGGIVLEPGATEPGSLTGNVFADSRDTGITWALAQLKKTGVEFPYSIVYYADQDNTIAVKFSGTAKVNSFRLPFSKPGMAKHPLDLALASADMARPTAAAA